MNLITPFALLIMSALIFFGYVNPVYRTSVDSEGNPNSILELNNVLTQYSNVLKNQVALKNKVEDLTNRRARISQENIDSLKKMLPDSVDNVRLIVEIEKIVKDYSMQGLKSVNINKTQGSAAGSATNAIVSEGEKYNSLAINFTVAMSYENFIRFLQRLEANLRLSDITSISFSANDLGNYDFSISLKTYWLK
ncbi:MAG: hypothetical protein WCO30_00875 [bacterium]